MGNWGRLPGDNGDGKTTRICTRASGRAGRPGGGAAKGWSEASRGPGRGAVYVGKLEKKGLL